MKWQELFSKNSLKMNPFNAAGKRQTSFASCDVMPDIDS